MAVVVVVVDALAAAYPVVVEEGVGDESMEEVLVDELVSPTRIVIVVSCGTRRLLYMCLPGVRLVSYTRTSMLNASAFPARSSPSSFKGLLNPIGLGGDGDRGLLGKRWLKLAFASSSPTAGTPTSGAR